MGTPGPATNTGATRSESATDPLSARADPLGTACSTSSLVREGEVDGRRLPTRMDKRAPAENGLPKES